MREGTNKKPSDEPGAEKSGASQQYGQVCIVVELNGFNFQHCKFFLQTEQ